MGDDKRYPPYFYHLQAVGEREPHKRHLTLTHYFTYSSPFGSVGIHFSDYGLEQVIWLPQDNKPILPHPLAHEIQTQLNAYFNQPTFRFDLPIQVKGTTFQLKVWKALQAIPAGKTLTYGQLAKELNTHPRAIGGACRTNPLPIVIPCHRITAQKGLGGYTGNIKGPFAAIKKWLLNHEQS